MIEAQSKIVLVPQASDTVAGSSMLRKFYQLKGVAGFSTPSSEHSTVTTWGREGEAQAHRHMLEVYEEGTSGGEGEGEGARE